MLDRLVELVVQFIDLFKFLRVVHAYQEAVLLRRGLFVRVLGPGWHLVIPGSIDEVICESVVTDTTHTPVQHLTTADGKNCAVSMVLTFRVADVRKLLLEVEGRQQAMLDAATGVIAEHVVGAKWKDLRGREVIDTIRTDIADRAARWGIELEEAKWHDLVKSETYAVMGLQSLLHSV